MSFKRLLAKHIADSLFPVKKTKRIRKPPQNTGCLVSLITFIILVTVGFILWL